MKMFARLILFVLIISSCTTTPASPSNRKTKNIKQFLLSLDTEERFFLEFFFRSLIQDDSIGYVLLGGVSLWAFTPI